MQESLLKLVAEERCDFEEDLMQLTQENRLAQVKQFLVDMMDYTEQSDEEEIYVGLYNFLKSKEKK